MSGFIHAANSNEPGPRVYQPKFSGDNEWYTPARYVEMAREVMGAIDTDPASNATAQRTVRAATYYTAETNGLDKDWHGKVWMNPPYSRDLMPRFASKLISEYRSGRVTEAIVLTNNATDTAWFASLFDSAGAFCFTRGRIRFESPTKRNGGTLQMGQVFTYFGDKPARFYSVFSEIGHCMYAAMPAQQLTVAA
ncbi:DNA N-6-adenine-methyltransferase [Gellertiella hungarica]|uniref:Phage N-6-adenine-methyltransferase n=1 Tax=Gellertiella hungarica TaxID=1572859 RepID=A0A7W6J641_9HYPH|nr:DNA N-6-adenine-methyltransferase [Gellertiella hungarica]MBB4065476.1 phage N-6-adenine-methyltransferase [Gellertiella hungarica]